MPPAGFEPAISASEQPQTYALDRAATGTGTFGIYTNVTLKVSINIIPLLILLTCEFACRWPKAETGYVYVNNQPVYNVSGSTFLISYAVRRTAQGFIKYHQ